MVAGLAVLALVRIRPHGKVVADNDPDAPVKEDVLAKAEASK